MSGKLDRQVFLAKRITYIYSTIIGIFPFIYKKDRNRFEVSKAVTVYSLILNVTILMMFPFSLYIFMNSTQRTENVLSNATSWIEGYNLYATFFATFLERLMARKKALQLINQTQSLSERLHSNENCHIVPQHTTISRFLLLKTVLPVNQVISIWGMLSDGQARNTWSVIGHSVVVFTFGVLFAIVNTFSMGNLSFRLSYDAINNKFSRIMDSLRSKRATYFQRLRAYPNFGTQYSYSCEVSAAINNLAALHSEMYKHVSETYQIFQYQVLGALVFLFLTNIVNLFQLYSILGVLVEAEYFTTALSMGIFVVWNFSDIFLLFYATSLVNEGSTFGRNALYVQFDSLYSNVELDRSVSQ